MGLQIGRGGLFRRRTLGAAGVLGLIMLCEAPAQAFEINAGPDWKIHWDNNFQYNLGIRAQGIDPNIGNNPVYSENDYKFASAGDIVTNRINDLSEFDAEYFGAGNDIGLRVSGSGWKDFAYDDNVKNHPGDVAPNTPYSSLNSYTNNKFTDHTSRFYVAGGQLLDAFAFSNFKLFGLSNSIKVGRLTEFWGNALFFGTQGINYSQNAADNIKGAAAPGTQAKELAIPRTQLLFATQLTHDLSLEGQYFAEFYGNRLPEGGTYLGITGFLFDGPQFLEGQLPHSPDFKPGGFHSNYGVKMGWSPAWLRGALGVYYRHLDETQPWAPLFAGANVPGLGIVPTNYHLAYAQNVRLYGISLDKQIGDYSTGFEVSYRQHTGLNSSPLNVAEIAASGSSAGQEGARGDTVNIIANTLGGLTPSALYDTGIFIAELAFTHKTSVTSNANLYNGVENSGAAGACPTGNKWDGCSTTNALSFGGEFDPSWLQVLPGLDLDMPLFAEYGIYGNTASLGAPVNQGGIAYFGGVHALFRQIYNFTIQYNGYYSHHNGGLTDVAASQGIAPGTPGFPSYYASGNGTYMYNDKGWVSLTFAVSF